MTLDSQRDYIRTDQLEEAAVAVSYLPKLFGVSESTIRRWLRKDNIKTFPHPVNESRPGIPDIAVRFGDIPINKEGTTRWAVPLNE